MLGSIPPKLLPMAPAPKPEPNMLKGLLCESLGIPANPPKGLLGACVVLVLSFVVVVKEGVVVTGVVVVLAAAGVAVVANKKKEFQVSI